MKRLWVIGLSACLAWGCAKGAEETETKPLPPLLDEHVLDAVPADIPQRTFIDFEGKVHLVGYDVQPEGVVAPGGTVKLTLYWKSVSKLSPGWKLFTHLVDPRGHRFPSGGNIDNVGPLRQGSGNEQALPPSAWEPGKVYLDTQEFQIPRDVKTPMVTITVGIWRENDRLDVISGPHDRERRAIVAHVPTGVKPPKPVRKVAQAEKQ